MGLSCLFNPLTAEWALRALIDFTLSNARRFYSSKGNPLDWKGLMQKLFLEVGKYMIFMNWLILPLWQLGINALSLFERGTSVDATKICTRVNLSGNFGGGAVFREVLDSSLKKRRIGSAVTWTDFKVWIIYHCNRTIDRGMNSYACLLYTSPSPRDA